MHIDQAREDEVAGEIAHLRVGRIVRRGIAYLRDSCASTPLARMARLVARPRAIAARMLISRAAGQGDVTVKSAEWYRAEQTGQPKSSFGRNSRTGLTRSAPARCQAAGAQGGGRGRRGDAACSIGHLIRPFIAHLARTRTRSTALRGMGIGPQLALTMSTEISTAGVDPLFSSQCVVFLSSGQPTPGP